MHARPVSDLHAISLPEPDAHPHAERYCSAYAIAHSTRSADAYA